MLHCEQGEDRPRKDVKRGRGDEEVERCEGNLTGSEGRIGEDGFVGEDLETIVSSHCARSGVCFSGCSLTMPIVARVLTVIHTVSLRRLFGSGGPVARASDFSCSRSTNLVRSASSLYKVNAALSTSVFSSPKADEIRPDSLNRLMIGRSRSANSTLVIVSSYGINLVSEKGLSQRTSPKPWRSSTCK